MKPFYKSPLKFSVFGLVFLVLMFFILHFMDRNPLMAGKMFDFLIIPLFVFLTVKEFKDYHNGKQLRFWQGMSIGWIYLLGVGVLYFSFLSLISATAFGEYFDQYRTLNYEKVVANEEQIMENFGKEAYDQMLLAKNASDFKIIWIDIRNKLLVGLFIIPIVSLFMRTSESKRK